MLQCPRLGGPHRPRLEVLASAVGGPHVDAQGTRRRHLCYPRLSGSALLCFFLEWQRAGGRVKNQSQLPVGRVDAVRREEEAVDKATGRTWDLTGRTDSRKSKPLQWGVRTTPAVLVLRLAALLARRLRRCEKA